MKNLVIVGAVLGAVMMSAQQKPEVPEVDAGAGACWVDFSVTQDHKPVYNAKVQAQVRYGWVHKTELEVGTNYEGRARVSGLPQKVRKPPLEFAVRKDDVAVTLPHDPAANCHAHYDVELPAEK